MCASKRIALIENTNAVLVHEKLEPEIQEMPGGKKYRVVENFKKYASGKKEYISYDVLAEGFEHISDAARFRTDYLRRKAFTPK